MSSIEIPSMPSTKKSSGTSGSATGAVRIGPELVPVHIPREPGHLFFRIGLAHDAQGRKDRQIGLKALLAAFVDDQAVVPVGCVESDHARGKGFKCQLGLEIEQFLQAVVLEEDFAGFEKAVFQALEKADHNQVRAAKLLGISRDTLRYRMKKFGLLEDAPR